MVHRAKHVGRMHHLVCPTNGQPAVGSLFTRRSTSAGCSARRSWSSRSCPYYCARTPVDRGRAAPPVSLGPFRPREIADREAGGERVRRVEHVVGEPEIHAWPPIVGTTPWR